MKRKREIERNDKKATKEHGVRKEIGSPIKRVQKQN